jgi:tetratricopeptide (TPR) repeat protein
MTTGAIALRRKNPYLLTGWFWYVGMLVPVIGVIHVGSQVHADRYTYLPQIGLYLALTWATVDFLGSWRFRRQILGGAAAAVVASLIWVASTQASHWRESESLWKHTLAVTSNNEVAHNQLGNMFLKKGLLDEAIFHYQKALEIWPSVAVFELNLGSALLRKGFVDEGISHLQKAVELTPDRDVPRREQALLDLGNALLRKGQVDDAIAQFQQALELQPADARAYNDLGNALQQKGLIAEAIAHFHKALELLSARPDAAKVHCNLGNALRLNGSVREAIAHYEEALKREPQSLPARNELAWVLATCSDRSVRNASKALELAQQANHMSDGRDAFVLRILAAAHAENGQFSEAVEIARRALELGLTQGNAALVEALRKEIALYEAGLPYHEPPK